MTFPSRPDHPDFWLISKVLIDTDAQADASTSSFDEILSRVVDPESVVYAAKQRALRLGGTDMSAELEAQLASMWLDGFVAGSQYQSLKSLEQ